LGGISNPTIRSSKSEEGQLLGALSGTQAPRRSKSEEIPVLAEKSEEGQLVSGVPLVGGLLGGISNPTIRRSKSEEIPVLAEKSEEGQLLGALSGTQAPRRSKSEEIPVLAEKSEEGQLVSGVPLVGGLLGGISNPTIRSSKSEEGQLLGALSGTQAPRRSKSEEIPVLAEKSEEGQLVSGVPLVGGLLGGISNPTIRSSKSEEGQLVSGASPFRRPKDHEGSVLLQAHHNLRRFH